MANKFTDCKECISRWTNQDCSECDSGEMFETDNDLNLNDENMEFDNE